VLQHLLAGSMTQRGPAGRQRLRSQNERRRLRRGEHGILPKRPLVLGYELGELSEPGRYLVHRGSQSAVFPEHAADQLHELR
jgi:hypothetical protein